MSLIRLVAASVATMLVGSFVILVIFGVIPPMRSFARLHEPLPTAVIEDGHIVYCRLRCCDFRFPLPPDCTVERLDGVHGGFDTIHGSIRVVASSGSAFDMRAYATVLQQHGFHAEADACSLFASSTKPLGGSIQASCDSDTTATIRFGYFGDS